MLLLLLWSGFSLPTFSQTSSPTVTPVVPLVTDQLPDNAVVVDNQILFTIDARIGSFSPRFRAGIISNRIEAFAKNTALDVEALKITDNPLTLTTDIVVGDGVLVTISDADAEAAGKSRISLAYEYRRMILDAVVQYRKDYSLRNIAVGVVLSLIAAIALLVAIIALNRGICRISNKLREWQGTRIRSFSLFGSEVIPADRVADFFSELIKITRLAGLLLLISIYINLTLSFFPWTRGVSNAVFRYFVAALTILWERLISYLPNIFFIGLILLITSYVLKILRFLFAELGRGSITFPGFYQEWAKPTYNIVRFLVIAFAATIAFPYFPGSETPAFRGVSIFLGILFSLGSSAAVANVVAGIILTYTRAFKINDRVKISDTIGDVVEKTLLVTRIRTIKNVVITVPNAMVLNSHIINYSTSIQDADHALILHTTITLGYDVPWRRVHEVLKAAAIATSHVLEAPQPFVLQTSLDDFYVSYELNAYTRQPDMMARIYSELHQHIQDQCNEADIEILSPHYGAMRDGNQTTIPADYLPPDYTPPGFRVTPLDGLFDGSGDPSRRSPHNSNPQP